MMGAPTVLVEKIPSGTEVLDAFRMVEHHLQSRAFATLSIEAGGVNSMIPMLVAASLGIPIIDADGMGRAFPEIQMVTPSLQHGVAATPMAIGDEKGNRVLLETVDNFWTERLARTATVSLGCSTAVALYPMQARVAKKSPATRDAVARPTNRPDPARYPPPHESHDPIEALLDLLGGRRGWARARSPMCDARPSRVSLVVNSTSAAPARMPE